MTKSKKPSKVFTLLVQVGRRKGDGLPKGATGAGLLCFAAAKDEEEAVRETVAVLKTAELAPLDVTGYGDIDERRAAGQEVGEDEIELMNRALEENAVVVAQMTPYFGDEEAAK